MSCYIQKGEAQDEHRKKEFDKLVKMAEGAELEESSEEEDDDDFEKDDEEDDDDDDDADDDE